jgi:hypothetical protein
VTTPGIPHLDIESLDHFDRIIAAGATSMADWPAVVVADFEHAQQRRQ